MDRRGTCGGGGRRRGVRRGHSTGRKAKLTSISSGTTAYVTSDREPTTRYTGTFPATEEVFGIKVDSSTPHVDVWIDGQDRVRRMQLVVTTAVNEEGGQVATEITIDYVDFGPVPKIELPPADEVLNVTDEVESKAQEAADGH